MSASTSTRGDPVGPGYRHTQGGGPLRLVFVGLLVMAVVGTQQAGAPLGVTSVFTALALALAVTFWSLTTEVTDTTIQVSFGPGLLRRRIALARVRDARVVRNRWFYGWGIRLTPHGWLWNIAGLDGVEVVFDNGRRFRIGTDDPHELAAAIAARIRPR